MGNVGGNIDGNNNSTITLGSGTTRGDVANDQNIIITGDRIFEGAGFATNSLKIDGDYTTKFTNDGTDIGAIDISTTGNNKPNINVAGNQNITGNWGSTDNPLGNLHITTAAKTVSIN